jgi:hypothetical protein
MEYDVLEGCLDMDQSSWMIGDSAQEGVGAGKCAPLARYAGKCHITQAGSIVQIINGQLM